MRERASAPRSSAHGVFWALHGARAASTATATTMSGMRRTSILPSSCSSRLCGACFLTGQSGHWSAVRRSAPCRRQHPGCVQADQPPHAACAHTTPSNSSPAATCGRERATAAALGLHAKKQRQGQNRMLRRVRALVLAVLGAVPCGMQLAPRRPLLRDHGRVAPLATTTSLTSSRAYLSVFLFNGSRDRPTLPPRTADLRPHAPCHPRPRPRPLHASPRSHRRACSQPNSVRGLCSWALAEEAQGGQGDLV